MRAELARRWERPVELVYLGSMRPFVKVPGRREDGTIKGQHRFRQCCHKVWRGTLRVAALVGSVGLIALAVWSGPSTIGPGWWPRARNRHTLLTGPAGCAAVQFLDAARTANKHLWLAWTSETVELVQASSKLPLRVRWFATAPDWPMVDFERGVMWWTDGSSAPLPIEQIELTRLADSQDRQRRANTPLRPLMDAID
ncbi:hypothetical protein [Solihabitans fulvus]|uniref:hypothetical protein n=1 Tax=Solihabitans fulvus TaxID=1892852 RepID=UPI001661F7C2|nr:hypothetical protein [Solihabitans fulvus]